MLVSFQEKKKKEKEKKTSSGDELTEKTLSTFIKAFSVETLARKTIPQHIVVFSESAWWQANSPVSVPGCNKNHF